MPERIVTGFGAQSTSSEVLEGVDLSRKRAIVTGASSGIGNETARALASVGAEVTLAVRNIAQGEQVAAAISASTGNSRIHVEHIELMDLASVRRFVDRWEGPLDILVNNAGIMAVPTLERDARGRELQFSTNYIGHFALATGLHGALAQAGSARVVSVSSTANMRSPVLFDDVDFRFIRYDPVLAYGQSKTANILFAVEAAVRWAADGIVVNSAHPGVILTNLIRHTGRITSPPEMRKTVEQGAATSVLLAGSPLVNGVTGRHFENCREAELVHEPPARFAFGVAPYALDPQNAKRLWEMTAQFILDEN